MSLKDLHTLPSLLPIPQLNRHIIGGGEDEGLGGVHNDGADVVRVRLEGGDLLRGVVVVYAQLEVVGSADDPVLARYKATRAHGDIGQLEGFDDRLGLVGPDVYMAWSIYVSSLTLGGGGRLSIPL